MATLSFNDILTQIGLSELDARNHELVLDAMIATEVKMMTESKSLDEPELDKLIKSEVGKVYTDYLKYITQDLSLSKQLLAQEKLEKYLNSI